jgi:hypothetical protein
MRIEEDEVEDLLWRIKPGQAIYWRFRNKDLDGSEQRFPVLVLYKDDDGKVFQSIIYPNPVRQWQPLTIETNIQDGPLYVSVFDINWRPVMQEVSVGGDITLQHNLPKWMYVTKVFNDQWDLNVDKIIVE